MTTTTPRSEAVSSGIERRRSPRTSMILPGALHQGESKTPVLTLDLSKHGVGFTTTTEIPAGTRCVIEIGSGPRRMIGEATTTRSQKIAPGLYRSGAEFC